MVEASPIKYNTNADINGADAFMHGYEARLGLGITRIKNHTIEAIPRKKKVNLV